MTFRRTSMCSWQKHRRWCSGGVHRSRNRRRSYSALRHRSTTNLQNRLTRCSGSVMLWVGLPESRILSRKPAGLSSNSLPTSLIQSASFSKPPRRASARRGARRCLPCSAGAIWGSVGLQLAFRVSTSSSVRLCNEWVPQPTLRVRQWRARVGMLRKLWQSCRSSQRITRDSIARRLRGVQRAHCGKCSTCATPNSMRCCRPASKGAASARCGSRSFLCSNRPTPSSARSSAVS
mmetsp:Transcript_8268/g.19552  ORF Transcript_8268/g.19552 Transcript_8268/m.19552 type:complete len:234 (+) Transcript_8268:489-1190(+)